jgi:translation initiation factor IF-3
LWGSPSSVRGAISRDGLASAVPRISPYFFSRSCLDPADLPSAGWFAAGLSVSRNPRAIIFHLRWSCWLTEDGIEKRFIRTNDRIRAREIRVIDDEGKQIGILPPYEALKMAKEKNLDLVEISPSAVPPVCRIMDYGKFLYQQEKKEREAKKHQKTITVKEVKFRINVDDHDYETKKNHVLRFLDEGDKVKATIFFRGREMTRTGLGRQILERLIKDVEGKSIVEFRPRQEGNTLHAILAPKKDAGQKPPASAPQQSRVNQA